MISWIVGNEFVRFLVVGGTATLLQMVLLLGFVEGLALEAVVASTIGYAVSSIYNYVLNYYLTFASEKSHFQTFPKFLIAVAIGLFCNAGVMALLLKLGIFYVIAQIGATVTTMVINFLIHKFWIYRN